MFSLIIKAIIIFVLMISLYRYNEKIAHGLGIIVAKINYDLGNLIYLTIKNMRDHLLINAFRILGIFAVAVLTPFFTIWLVSLYRSYKRKRAEVFWME